MHKKPAIGGPFSRSGKKFSETWTGWLTWENSISHMALWKIAFDMSHEFRRIFGKHRVGDFCTQ